MPEKILEKINARILPQWKTCFASAFAVGLLAHLYKMVNWLPNWDSLVFRYDSQNMIGLGRWFLPVVCSFSSFYDLPLLAGILAIVFHALASVFICRILNVQKKITAFLIGAVIVSFPTVTSVMMYNYVADGYSIAFFLSTLAAFFMTREKPRYFLASLFIALSVGIYQAYITVTIMLVLFKLIDMAVYKSASFLTVLKKSANMLLSGVAGMALYAIVLKIALSVFSTQLLDYQGINSAASFSEIDILGSVYTVKETFTNFFFDISNGVNVFVVLNAFVLLVTLAYYVRCIICNKLYKKPANVFIIVFLSVMLIFGAGALAFVNATVDYHNLMLMGYSVFYLFFLIIYERGEETAQRGTVIKCWIVFLTALLIIANQIVISNVSYHKAQMAYEKSYGVLIRISDRIEETAGNKECDRIVVIGALDDSEDYSVNLPPDITGITDGYIIRADDETVGQSVLCSALNDYCNKNYEFVYGKEKKAFAEMEEVKALEVWPENNCVAIINDTIVIKLGEEGEN